MFNKPALSIQLRLVIPVFFILNLILFSDAVFADPSTPDNDGIDDAVVLGRVYRAPNSSSGCSNRFYYGDNCGNSSCHGGPNYNINWSQSSTGRSGNLSNNSCHLDNPRYTTEDVVSPYGDRNGEYINISVNAGDPNLKLSGWYIETTTGDGTSCESYFTDETPRSGTFSTPGPNQSLTLEVYNWHDCRWNHIWFYEEDFTAPSCGSWSFNPNEPSSSNSIDITSRASDSLSGIDNAGLYVSSNPLDQSWAGWDEIRPNGTSSSGTISGTWGTSGKPSGDYRVQSNWWDEAGNLRSCTYDYTLDKSPPTATISGPNVVCAGDPVPYSITAEDENDLAGYGYKYKTHSGTNWSTFNNGDLILGGSFDTSHNSTRSHSFNNSGNYYVTVTAYDDANNKCSGNPDTDQISSYPQGGWYACDGNSNPTATDGVDYKDVQVLACDTSNTSMHKFSINRHAQVDTSGDFTFDFTDTSTSGTVAIDRTSETINGKYNICALKDKKRTPSTSDDEFFFDCFIGDSSDRTDGTADNTNPSDNLNQHIESSQGYNHKANVPITIIAANIPFPRNKPLTAETLGVPNGDYSVRVTASSGSTSTSAVSNFVLWSDDSNVDFQGGGTDAGTIVLSSDDPVDIVPLTIENICDTNIDPELSASSELCFSGQLDFSFENPENGTDFCRDTGNCLFCSNSDGTDCGSTDSIFMGSNTDEVTTYLKIDKLNNTSSGTYYIKPYVTGIRSLVETRVEDHPDTNDPADVYSYSGSDDKDNVIAYSTEGGEVLGTSSSGGGTGEVEVFVNDPPTCTVDVSGSGPYNPGENVTVTATINDSDGAESNATGVWDPSVGSGISPTSFSFNNSTYSDTWSLPNETDTSYRMTLEVTDEENSTATCHADVTMVNSGASIDSVSALNGNKSCSGTVNRTSTITYSLQNYQNGTITPIGSLCSASGVTCYFDRNNNNVYDSGENSTTAFVGNNNTVTMKVRMPSSLNPRSYTYGIRLAYRTSEGVNESETSTRAITINNCSPTCGDITLRPSEPAEGYNRNQDIEATFTASDVDGSNSNISNTFIASTGGVSPSSRSGSGGNVTWTMPNQNDITTRLTHNVKDEDHDSLGNGTAQCSISVDTIAASLVTQFDDVYEIDVNKVIHGTQTFSWNLDSDNNQSTLTIDRSSNTVDGSHNICVQPGISCYFVPPDADDEVIEVDDDNSDDLGPTEETNVRAGSIGVRVKSSTPVLPGLDEDLNYKIKVTMEEKDTANDHGLSSTSYAEVDIQRNLSNISYTCTNCSTALSNYHRGDPLLLNYQFTGTGTFTGPIDLSSLFFSNTSSNLCGSANVQCSFASTSCSSASSFNSGSASLDIDSEGGSANGCIRVVTNKEITPANVNYTVRFNAVGTREIPRTTVSATPSNTVNVINDDPTGTIDLTDNNTAGYSNFYTDSTYTASVNSISDTENNALTYSIQSSMGDLSLFNPAQTGTINTPYPNLSANWNPNSSTAVGGSYVTGTINANLRDNVNNANPPVSMSQAFSEPYYTLELQVRENLNEVLPDPSDMADQCDGDWGSTDPVTESVDVTLTDTSGNPVQIINPSNKPTSRTFTLSDSSLQTYPDVLADAPYGTPADHNISLDYSGYGSGGQGYQILCIREVGGSTDTETSSFTFSTEREETHEIRMVVGYEPIEGWFQGVGGSIYSKLNNTEYYLPGLSSILHPEFVDNRYLLSDSSRVEIDDTGSIEYEDLEDSAIASEAPISSSTGNIEDLTRQGIYANDSVCADDGCDADANGYEDELFNTDGASNVPDLNGETFAPGSKYLYTNSSVDDETELKTDSSVVLDAHQESHNDSYISSSGLNAQSFISGTTGGLASVQIKLDNPDSVTYIRIIEGSSPVGNSLATVGGGNIEHVGSGWYEADFSDRNVSLQDGDFYTIRWRLNWPANGSFIHDSNPYSGGRFYPSSDGSDDAAFRVYVEGDASPGIVSIHRDGDLDISENITNDSLNSVHYIFLVDGNLNIDESITQLDASFIVKGGITVQAESSGGANTQEDVPLLVNGSLISLDGNINLERSTMQIPESSNPPNNHYENKRPVETVVFQPTLYFGDRPENFDQIPIYVSSID